MFDQIGGCVALEIRRRVRLAAASAFAVVALGLSACTGGAGSTGSDAVDTASAGLAERVDEAVSTALELSGSTAAVAGVWTEGGDYVTAYGESAEAGSLIRGAEATQPVMCALLLDLAREGTVSLDREVSKDLPRQVNIEGITYRQLCDGTSGLANFRPQIVDLNANNPARNWPDRELLAQAFPHSPLSWPGLDVHVSATDTLLLSRALRAATNEGMRELLKTRVFQPAKMSKTYYPDSDDLTLGAKGLEGLTYPSSERAPVCEAGPVAVTEVSPSMLSGAGATVTTVTDLKRFYERYISGGYGGELGSVVTETRPQKNPERDADGEPKEEVETDPNIADQWGFGVQQTGPLFGRTGSITGTLTAAFHDPVSGLSVVVAVNNSSAGTGFIRALALQLAAIASEEGAGPELPWSADDQAAALADRAICQEQPESEE